MDSNLLKAKLVENDIKPAELATMLHKSRQAAYKKINGESEFTIEEFYIICDKLKLSDAEARKIFI